MKEIGALTQLTKLWIAEEDIGDADLEPLSSMKSLKELRVLICPFVTEESIKKLHKALTSCHIYSDHGEFKLVPPTVPNYTAERATAEWVLSVDQ